VHAYCLMRNPFNSVAPAGTASTASNNSTVNTAIQLAGICFLDASRFMVNCFSITFICIVKTGFSN